MQVDTAPRNEASFLELVLPEQANHYGTLYGANALHLMAKAAYVCASRHTRCTMVMAKADAVEFRSPIRLGELANIRARVHARGRSSITIRVDVFAENMTANQSRAAISGDFVMVAVDPSGAPIAIPEMNKTETEEVLP